MKSKAAIHPAEAALRALALGFPETYEDFPWGESAFKVKGKVFLFMYVHAEGIKLSVKLPESHERALANSFAEPTGYGLGKSGWVTCSFGPDERVPIPVFEGWIDESFRAVAPKKIVARLAGSSPTKPLTAGKSVAESHVRHETRAAKAAPGDAAAKPVPGRTARPGARPPKTAPRAVTKKPLTQPRAPRKTR